LVIAAGKERDENRGSLYIIEILLHEFQHTVQLDVHIFATHWLPHAEGSIRLLSALAAASLVSYSSCLRHSTALDPHSRPLPLLLDLSQPSVDIHSGVDESVA
jgi:hypothetical protein